ncbi:MAG TPA: GyrI-like domain-containing protein [Methanoregulaceae archaeon]|nr:GyrI-like domain-containing protein [Methanoregulaceae archaeon]
MDEIELVDLPPQGVLGIRRKGPYSQIPRMLGEVFAAVAERGAIPVGPPVYLSHETSASEALACQESGDADIEVAWGVAHRVTDVGEVRYYELPGGRFAKVVHRGPYETCAGTYARLFAWIAEKGLVVTGPVREYYLNVPSAVPPGEILTEICAPVG